MPLKVTDVKDAKSGDKPYKMTDGLGLFLLVNPTGSKLWKLKYYFEGKEKKLSLGAFPDVTLSQARKKRDEARSHVGNGIDPGELKKSLKRAQKEARENSFEAIAREWHTKVKSKWKQKHSETVIIRLEKYIFPWVGKSPIKDISAPDILGCLRRLESKGSIETAHRVLQICGQVFRYGIITGRALHDISADLKGALAPVKEKHHASITKPKEIGKLLRAIQSYNGSFITKCALTLIPLVFVRSSELRHAEWDEFNLENSEWRIPAERMKMKQPHIVPLSSQAIAILEEIKPLTGEGKYVFPGRSGKGTISDGTLIQALRRLDYTPEQMTIHGFRSMASTLLNEQGWNRDAIERQLAHSEKNKVRAAYNYAEYLPERREMMQHWGDYLEQLALPTLSMEEVK